MRNFYIELAMDKVQLHSIGTGGGLSSVTLITLWLKCPFCVPYVSLRVLSSFSHDLSSSCQKGRLNADHRMSPEVPHNSVVIEVSGSGSKQSNYSSCFSPCGLSEIPEPRATVSQGSQQDIPHRLL